MQKARLLGFLRNMGLSENEAAVYLAALSCGRATAADLARVAGVKRPTIYPVADTLSKRGLLTIGFKGTKRFFVAENPRVLRATIDEQHRMIGEVLPAFDSLYTARGNRADVEYYEGLRSVKNLYDLALTELRRGDEYLAVSNAAQWQDLDESWFRKFMERRAKLPVRIRLLLQDSAVARTYKDYEKNYGSQIKILPPGVSFSASIAITPRRVFIHQLQEPVAAVSMISPSMVRIHAEMFEFMWNSI